MLTCQHTSEVALKSSWFGWLVSENKPCEAHKSRWPWSTDRVTDYVFLFNKSNIFLVLFFVGLEFERIKQSLK